MTTFAVPLTFNVPPDKLRFPQTYKVPPVILTVPLLMLRSPQVPPEPIVVVFDAQPMFTISVVAVGQDIPPTPQELALQQVPERKFAVAVVDL